VKYVTFLIAIVFVAEELRRFVQAVLAIAADDVDASVSIRARPMMFMFLFTWALPLSFVPLNAAALPALAIHVPPQLAMAAPISVEMLCALMTAALAGWISDKAGWQVPTFVGLALSFIGAITAHYAGSFETFVLSRALTGLGYGFAWMGIQALVVGRTPANVMTFSVANMTAGIFTGHMLGTFAGGWIAQLVGFQGVFLFGAIALLLPTLYAATFLRVYFHGAHRSLHIAEKAAANIGKLVRSRQFILLIMTSVVPFSIAQVGLLYYAVPIILNRSGLPTSEIGAVIALYSSIFVFSAPLLARLIDRRSEKRNVVTIGGLLGGAALLSLFVIPGLMGVVVATAALAFASSIGGAAQTSYALQLSAARSAGIGFTTGIQRASDKLGQMLGPIVIGGLYTITTLTTALAIIGAVYLVCTFLFFATARRSSGSVVNGASGID
jgi:predicted MFS family arabinose efflux permease